MMKFGQENFSQGNIKRFDQTVQENRNLFIKIINLKTNSAILRRLYGLMKKEVVAKLMLL